MGSSRILWAVPGILERPKDTSLGLTKDFLGLPKDILEFPKAFLELPTESQGSSPGRAWRILLGTGLTHLALAC